jgi:SAM-dependent methyltransferase
MKLEIGGGTLCPSDWINLDPVHGDGDWLRYAQQLPWPAPDGSVSSIRASHVMEHIPAGAERIAVFNEAHRVLVPGGTFEVIVPGAVARGPGEMLGWWAIADPTHVSFWVPESFAYLDGSFAPNADYGIRPWETLELEVRNGWEIHWRGTPR